MKSLTAEGIKARLGKLHIPDLYDVPYCALAMNMILPARDILTQNSYTLRRDFSKKEKHCQKIAGIFLPNLLVSEISLF